MKKILIPLLLISYLNINSNLSLKAIDSGESNLQIDQSENQKGFKAWIRANPKKTAAIVVAAIATIIGGGIGIHRLATKKWIWQSDEGKPKGKTDTSKAKTQKELTPEELEAQKKLEEGRKKFAKFGPTDKIVEQVAFNNPKFLENLKDKANEFLTSIDEAPLESHKLDDIWNRFAELRKKIKEDKNDKAQQELDKFDTITPLLFKEQGEKVKQNFDPSQMTADDIRKFEETEKESNEKFLKNVVEEQPHATSRDYVTSNMIIVSLKSWLEQVNGAIEGETNSLIDSYPLLDLQKAKDALEKRIAELGK